MKKAFCGIDCEKCKVYIATINNDNFLRGEVAKEWGRLYKRDFKLEDIYCEGCKSDKSFMLCQNCDIINCNKEKDIDNCTACSQYQCSRIKRFYDYQKNNKDLLYIE